MKQFKTNEKHNSNKLHLDKYYTSDKLAKYCVDKTLEVIGEENITQFIEPSAGAGAFLNHLPMKITKAFDIEPEDPRVIQYDFLEAKAQYKKGRCFIGNPPYGSRMSLAQKFCDKCFLLGDYVSFILPISQLNNTQSIYKFDLIHSEDLGKTEYSGRLVHCCLNIYKRPKERLNKKPIVSLSFLHICRQDSKKFKDVNTPYDFIMCYWGEGCAGKIVPVEGTYSAEYKIYIDNIPQKNDIIQALKSKEFIEAREYTAMKKIQQFHIVTFLCNKFPTLIINEKENK